MSRGTYVILSSHESAWFIEARLLKPHKTLIGILLAAACLYVAYAPAYYVGYLNDDATYILAAQSLRTGHYQALQLPHEPPLTIFPPAYPVFLPPVVT